MSANEMASVSTLVPEINRKSFAREGSKNAIFFCTVSYAATCVYGKEED